MALQRAQVASVLRCVVVVGGSSFRLSVFWGVPSLYAPCEGSFEYLIC